MLKESTVLRLSLNPNWDSVKICSCSHYVFKRLRRHNENSLAKELISVMPL